jgi:hypothetical protein
MRKKEEDAGPHTVYVREYKTETSGRRAGRAGHENREPTGCRCLDCNQTKHRDDMELLDSGDISTCCKQCWAEFPRFATW